MPRRNKKPRSGHLSRPKGHTAARSYTPVSDALKQPFSFADTELAEGISRHGLVGLLAGALSRKRRQDGEPLGNVHPVDKPKDKPFKDQRSSAARDMRSSWELNKHQMFRRMLQRALKAGLSAAYRVADAWFGCKENIALALEAELIGIFQMKRGKLAERPLSSRLCVGAFSRPALPTAL